MPGDGSAFDAIDSEWESIADVTQAGGVCAGEEDQPSDSTIVRLERTGDNSYEVTELGGPGSEV